jgi:hypothetical protein
MEDKRQPEEANQPNPVSLGGKRTLFHLIAIVGVTILLLFLIRFTLL